MSGGSLNYVYSSLTDTIISISHRSQKPLHRAFANHLQKVSEALHDLEWELSDDYGPGEADEAIKACITNELILEELITSAKKAQQELSDFLVDIEKKL